jgi:hypothetical protein
MSVYKYNAAPDEALTPPFLCPSRIINGLLTLFSFLRSSLV